MNAGTDILLHPSEDRALRVLVVEDEMLVAMMLEDILTDMGCVVVGIASSASAALVAAASTRVDVAMMDVDILGPVDGVGAAGAILERHGIRSVFVTARCDKAFHERAGRVSPIGFVDKPYHKSEIEGAMRAARLALVPAIPAALAA